MTEKSVDERLAFFAERELNPHYKRMFTDAQADLARLQKRLVEAERLLRLSWIVPSCDFDLERDVIAFLDPAGLGIRTPIRTADQPDVTACCHQWSPYTDNFGNVWRECMKCGHPEGVLISKPSGAADD